MTSNTPFTPMTQEPISQFEIYSSALTTNTALRLISVALTAACCFLALEVGRLSREVAAQKPVVIRVDEVGRAQAVDWRYHTFEPRDAELQYFLNRFIVGFYGRNHRTLKDAYPMACRYLSDAQFSMVAAQEQQFHWIAKFLSSSDDDADIQVRTISVDDSHKPVFRAQVDYTKIYSNGAGLETKRESFTDLLYFAIDPALGAKNPETNPLGFSITSLHEDQAFQK